MESNEYIWQDRKRVLFGLPWSFTRYKLTESKLLIDVGFFNREEDEVRLYRIMDITLRRSFGERLFNLGTIHCCSGDKSSPEFDIKHIKRPQEIKEILSDMVEKARNEHRIGVREFMDDDDHDELDMENGD